MKTVWVVTVYSCPERYLSGVFSTKEKAEEAAKFLENAYVEECSFDFDLAPYDGTKLFAVNKKGDKLWTWHPSEFHHECVSPDIKKALLDGQEVFTCFCYANSEKEALARGDRMIEEYKRKNR